MLTRQRCRTVLIAGLAVPALVAGFTASSSSALTTHAVEPTASSECPTAAEAQDGVLLQDEAEGGTDVIECDLVGMKIAVLDAEGSPTVEVSPPGEGLSLSLYAETGEPLELFVGTEPDGQLSYDGDPGGGPGFEAPGAPSACDDTAGNPASGGPLGNNETFEIKVTTFPNYLNEANSRAAIEAGIRAWPTQYNDCGMPDLISKTVNDGGGTTAASSVVAAGCTVANNDSVSVFSFGVIYEVPDQGIPLGVTCRHVLYSSFGPYSDGGDVKFNATYPWTNTPNATSCSGDIDLQSVATHEAGHWFGVGHVSPYTHPNLTMRGGGVTAVLCRSALRTLGRGDVLSMREVS